MSDNVLFAVLFALMGLAVIFVGGFVIVDQTCGRWSYESGTVVQHLYQPHTSSVGVGYAFHAKGGGPVVVSSSTREKYLLLVNAEGSVLSIETSPQGYANADGSTINLRHWIGKFTRDGRWEIQ